MFASLRSAGGTYGQCCREPCDFRRRSVRVSDRPIEGRSERKRRGEPPEVTPSGSILLAREPRGLFFHSFRLLQVCRRRSDRRRRRRIHNLKSPRSFREEKRERKRECHAWRIISERSVIGTFPTGRDVARVRRGASDSGNGRGREKEGENRTRSGIGAGSRF